MACLSFRMPVVLADHGTAGRHDSPGVSLHSVRARARAAGGDYSIRSGPGGTTVEAVFPLGEPERPLPRPPWPRVTWIPGPGLWSSRERRQRG